MYEWLHDYILKAKVCLLEKNFFTPQAASFKKNKIPLILAFRFEANSAVSSKCTFFPELCPLWMIRSLKYSMWHSVWNILCHLYTHIMEPWPKVLIQCEKNSWNLKKKLRCSFKLRFNSNWLRHTLNWVWNEDRD